MNKSKDETMGNQQVSQISLENFKELVAYPGYWVNSVGDVLSTVRTVPKIIKRRIHYGKSKNPYYRSKVAGNNALAHRVIASIHIGRVLKDDEVVNHIDGNTLNNSPDNLEVVSQKQNVEHAVANKLYCSGDAWYAARGLNK